MKRFFSLLLLFFVFLQLLFAQQNTADPQSDDIVKILAIGNSFSEDGIENYLFELAQTTNKKMIIGNLYIPGAALALHVKNSRTDAAAYNYRKIDVDGKKDVTDKVSIAQALAQENWDYISFQQTSSLSGKTETILQSLPELLQYVRERALPQTQFVYHQTWAYQQDSKHKGFANYNNDQQKMYRAIVASSKELFAPSKKNPETLKALRYLNLLIPAGTAIQNGRTSSLADHFTRDGYHLQLDYGRFTAACTWYEKLFNKDVRKNPYRPENVTEQQARIAKKAAHKACKKPFKISKIKD